VRQYQSRGDREDLAAAGAAATMLIEAYLTPRSDPGRRRIVLSTRSTVPKGQPGAEDRFFLCRAGPVRNGSRTVPLCPARSAADSTTRFRAGRGRPLWSSTTMRYLDVPSPRAEAHPRRSGPARIAPDPTRRPCPTAVDNLGSPWRSFGFTCRLAYKCEQPLCGPARRTRRGDRSYPHRYESETIVLSSRWTSTGGAAEDLNEAQRSGTEARSAALAHSGGAGPGHIHDRWYGAQCLPHR